MLFDLDKETFNEKYSKKELVLVDFGLHGVEDVKV